MAVKEKKNVVLICGFCGNEVTAAKDHEKVYCEVCLDRTCGNMNSLMYEKKED